jgi:cysteinyl-tRNA synthetase
VLDALLDDLNTPKAIAELHKLHSAGHWGALRNALEFLGFSCDRARIGRTASAVGKAQLRFSAEAVGERIEARNAARKAKNFAEADRIRGELEAMGVTLKDAKDPKTGELVTTWEVAR